MKRIVILMSGSGSNMRSIHRAIEGKEIKNLYLAGIITENQSIKPVRSAKYREKHVPMRTMRRKDFKSNKEYDEELIAIVKYWRPDLIVLSGFMHILGKKFISEFTPNIVNIHPSLLPKYKGKDTHQRVYKAKETKHGFTIHMVTEKVDDGPIIFQKKLSIDNLKKEEIETKVKREENLFYPMILDLIGSNNIVLNNDGVAIGKGGIVIEERYSEQKLF